MRAFDERTTSPREASLIRGLRAGASTSVPPFPLKVQLQTTTRCNAACLMCPYPDVTSEPGFEHGEMSADLYGAIVAELAENPVERLSLFLMNEPLLDRRMVDWIALARARLPSVTLNLFSNGAALRLPLALKLAAAGLDELCVSVHGFERETYDRVMVGLSFERMEPQLRELFEAQRAGALAPMRLKIVAGDVPEVVATLERAHASYRDHVLLKAFSNERAIAQVPSAMETSAPRTSAPPEPPLCQRPFVKLYILANGDCILCNVDWRRTVVLGRIDPRRGIGIREIWNGSRYREVRERHLDHALGPDLPCHQCDYAAVTDDA